MADFYSTQIAGLLASPKVFAPSTEWHAKMRIMRYDYVSPAGGADGDRVVLAELPKGRLQVLLYPSIISFTAFGAARVMAVGWDAHEGVDSLGNPETVPADQNGLADAIDIATAGDLVGSAWNGAGLTADKSIEFRSREGVTISAQITGDTIPVDANLRGYLVYTCE